MKKTILLFVLFLTGKAFSQVPDSLKTDTLLIISYETMAELPGTDFSSKFYNKAIKNSNRNVESNNKYQEKCLKDYPYPYKFITPTDFVSGKTGNAKYILNWKVEQKYVGTFGNASDSPVYNAKTGKYEHNKDNFYIYHVQDLRTKNIYVIEASGPARSQQQSFKRALKEIRQHFEKQ